jgi:hypothetical protein
MDEFLNKLSDCTNRSYGQTLFLFNLLDRDRKKLVLLEQKIKNNHLHYCPGTKEDCEEVLSMGDGSGWAFADERYSHLDVFLNKEDKLGKECIFKATGHKGKIISELDYKLDPLKRNFKRELFPAQWGIYWYHDAERTQQYKGLLHFWQDKDKIDFQR